VGDEEKKRELELPRPQKIRTDKSRFGGGREHYQQKSRMEGIQNNVRIRLREGGTRSSFKIWKAKKKIGKGELTRGGRGALCQGR